MRDLYYPPGVPLDCTEMQTAYHSVVRAVAKALPIGRAGGWAGGGGGLAGGMGGNPGPGGPIPISGEDAPGAPPRPGGDTGSIGYWLRHPNPERDLRTGWRPMSEAPRNGTQIDARNRHNGRTYALIPVTITLADGNITYGWAEIGVHGCFYDDAFSGWLPH